MSALTNLKAKIVALSQKMLSYNYKIDNGQDTYGTDLSQAIEDYCEEKITEEGLVPPVAETDPVFDTWKTTTPPAYPGDALSQFTEDVTHRTVTDSEKADFHAHTNKTALDAVDGVNTGDQSSSDFDIKDLSDITSLRNTWSGKQDALTFSTDIETDKASTTKVSAIKTFYDWAVSKFINIAISKTYAELSAMKSASELVVGQLYLISDYRTKYTQPNSLEVITCAEEPILVKAVTNDSFSTLAFSTLYPEDILTYSFENHVVNAPGADRGYIIRRVDTKREVDAPFDFRYVKFRRWGITAADWDINTNYTAKVPVKRNGKLYLSSCNANLGNDPATTSTESTLDTYYWIFLPIPDGSNIANNSLGEAGGITFTPTGLYDDYLMFSDNIIYSQTRNFKILLRGWHIDNGGTTTDHTIWHPVNTVFFNYGLGTYYGVSNCQIGGDFFNNTFLSGFGMSTTHQIFYNNLLCRGVENCYFHAHVRYNIFANSLYHDSFYSWDFQYNVLGGYVEQTLFGEGEVYNNVFSSYIDNSQLQAYFEENIFQGYMRYSTFRGGYVYKNIVKHNWTYNTVTGYFGSNTFVGVTKYNVFETYVKSNVFGGETSYNNFIATFMSNTTTALFKNNTCRLTGYNTFNGACEKCYFENNTMYNTFPAMAHIYFKRNIQSKDMSTLPLTTQQYTFEKLPNNSVQYSYLDNFGIENSNTI